MRNKILPVFLLLIAVSFSSFAEGVKGDPENEAKVRIGADFKFDLVKALDLTISPEMRFADGLSVDKYLFDAGLVYKTFGCVYWGATYRYVIDRQEYYSSENYGRYAFDVTYKDKFDRFTPSFRLRYNNYADEDVSEEEFLRYRAKLSYNIPRSKITPSVAIEAFHELDDNVLYKMRYSAGFDFKVDKSTSLSLDYKFDFFCVKYKNVHVISAGYKYKF